VVGCLTMLLRDPSRHVAIVVTAFRDAGKVSIIEGDDTKDFDVHDGAFHGIRECRCMVWHVEEGDGVERRYS